MSRLTNFLLSIRTTFDLVPWYQSLCFAQELTRKVRFKRFNCVLDCSVLASHVQRQEESVMKNGSEIFCDNFAYARKKHYESKASNHEMSTCQLASETFVHVHEFKGLDEQKTFTNLFNYKHIKKENLERYNRNYFVTLSYEKSFYSKGVHVNYWSLQQNTQPSAILSSPQHYFSTFLRVCFPFFPLFLFLLRVRSPRAPHALPRLRKRRLSATSRALVPLTYSEPGGRPVASVTSGAFSPFPATIIWLMYSSTNTGSAG